MRLNCQKLHQNINATLATTFRRNPHDDDSTFVADISVCKATPFYGLHSGWRLYYKISLLSPKHVTRLADLFRSGAILGRSYQPYESHVPYLLQFMIDYNLYGCGTVRCSSVYFRSPLPKGKITPHGNISSDDPSHDSVHSLYGHSYLSSETVPAIRLLHAEYSRCSNTQLELDMPAGAIMNRSALKQRLLHHDIVKEGTVELSTDERILPSLTELWRDDAKRREQLGMTPSRSQAPQSNVRQRSNVWNNESELKGALEAILQEKAAPKKDSDDGFDSLENEIIHRIPTSFESIQNFCVVHSEIFANSLHSRVHITKSRPRNSIMRKMAQQDITRPSNLPPLNVNKRIPGSSNALPLPSDNGQTMYTFQHASIIDLDCEYVRSRTSGYLNKALRLRGGYVAESDHDAARQTLQYSADPPTNTAMSLTRLNVVSSAFPEPFYSDARDVPALAREYAANGMMPRSIEAPHLPSFWVCEKTSSMTNTSKSPVKYQYHISPPTLDQMKTTWALESRKSATKKRKSTQIQLPTQGGLALSSAGAQKRLSDADVPLSVLSLEIHAQSTGTLLPNPTTDAVVAIFWAFQDFGLSEAIKDGCILSLQHMDEYDGLRKLPKGSIEFVDSEIDLIHDFVDLVRDLDPDAVLSFEMQNSSVGYLEERTKACFGFSVQAELGRIVAAEIDKPGYNDRWGETHATSVKISGRHVLNLWRIMRSEMNLLQYTLENVCYHQLRLRIPKYNHQDLQKWFMSGRAGPQQRVYNYYVQRTRLNLKIIESQGLLSRVSEQARLLGIDFYSVFSRGSQFKVESLMFRIAKPECFMMMSPSKKQVAQQNALECLPLVMEPQSRFYHDPVVVLDFQSLYPSIMIAYNFCYSTCLGKLGYRGLESKLGVMRYEPEKSTMQEVSKDIEIAPNGVLYVQDHRRKSLLAKMLHDLLETRAMVKEGMKLCKSDKAAQKLMHNRQLALKLIANVTYGYTSASFSGRMPCADIADSIVQTGRETLEKAIEFIHEHQTWNAEVVYGDTDSLFVKLPRRSKQEAFDIGAQMAAEITRMSPSPIKLKFEKVYLPCVLLAKKRYVGFKYESPQDTEPVFDAKGIETVRRDGTPAEQKIEEQALKILFRTGDLSAVKDFFQQECWKIMTGRCSLHDFCFAKEVKLGTYSTKGLPPPGAVISAKSIAADPRSEPQYGERVSYLVISGASRSRLTDRCVPPEELLLNPDLRLDVEYYITKNIVPPLDRIFSLMGVNVRSWYDEMPRSMKLVNKIRRAMPSKTSKMIETFLNSSHCPVCQRELLKPGICTVCASRPDNTVYDLQQISQAAERTHNNILKVCASCCRVPMYSEIACMSKDCPVYYKRVKSGREVDTNLVHDLQPLLDMQ